MVPSNKLKQTKQDNYAFMTCILKVYTSTPGWQKTVMKVLNNIHGIYNFKMDEGGIVEVSGKVTPTLLLKMLGKAGNKAEVLWWQFGECSSNLFMPARYRNDMNGYNGGYGGSSYYGGGDNYIGHGENSYYGGYGETNYYGDNSYYGYGDHGYETRYGGTNYYGGAPPRSRRSHNPFLGSTRPHTSGSVAAGGSVASSRQAYTARSLPLDSEGAPSCCTMM